MLVKIEKFLYYMMLCFLNATPGVLSCFLADCSVRQKGLPTLILSPDFMPSIVLCRVLRYVVFDLIMSLLIIHQIFSLRSRKTVRFSEQIMSADKYPSIFSRQMKAIVYILSKTLLLLLLTYL